MSDYPLLKQLPEVERVIIDVAREFGDAAKIVTGHMAIGIFGSERHNDAKHPNLNRGTWKRHDFIAHSYMTNHAFGQLREITGTQAAVLIRQRLEAAMNAAHQLNLRLE